MSKKAKAYLLFFTIALVGLSFCQQEKPNILWHKVNPQESQIKLYWKDSTNTPFGSFARLKSHIEQQNQSLLFAMNGGMYMKDQTPLGLYIENGEKQKKLNKVKDAHGNFYLQPNGVFYLTHDNQAFVCKTTSFKHSPNIEFATQSGPMLVIDGKIHSAFTPNSKNVHIRNGVGILPDGMILFAMSQKPICLYDFAMFFKNEGCHNALYLDGFVSRTYLPEKRSHHLDGNFGVIIAETKEIN